MDGYGAEDRNCWKSGCHGPDHSPETFLFPQNETVPALAGTGKLARFQNSQELHDFIRAIMPWWDPGQLTDPEAWQVSAYVLSLQKAMPANLELKDTNGSAITTQYAVPQPGNYRPAVYACRRASLRWLRLVWSRRICGKTVLTKQKNRTSSTIYIHQLSLPGRGVYATHSEPVGWQFSSVRFCQRQASWRCSITSRYLSTPPSP